MQFFFRKENWFHQRNMSIWKLFSLYHNEWLIDRIILVNRSWIEAASRKNSLDQHSKVSATWCSMHFIITDDGNIRYKKSLILFSLSFDFDHLIFFHWQTDPDYLTFIRTSCTGCNAYFCCSLAGKIDESKISCCCVPNVLAVYRMKVRSVLHIQVREDD